MSSRFFKRSIIESYKNTLDKYTKENYKIFNFESLNAYIIGLYKRTGLTKGKKGEETLIAKQTIKTELIKFMCKNTSSDNTMDIMKSLFGKSGTSKYDILILIKYYDFTKQRNISKRIDDFFDNIRGILIVELDSYSIKVLCSKKTESTIDYKQILSDAYDYTIKNTPIEKKDRKNNQEEEYEYKADFEEEDEDEDEDEYEHDVFEKEDEDEEKEYEADFEKDEDADGEEEIIEEEKKIIDIPKNTKIKHKKEEIYKPVKPRILKPSITFKQVSKNIGGKQMRHTKRRPKSKRTKRSKRKTRKQRRR